MRYLMNNLIYRKSTINDLKAIIVLLIEDELGAAREDAKDKTKYIDAFRKIDAAPNHPADY